MRLIFTILLFTVFSIAYSQKLTGIWRGTFEQRQPDPFTGEWQTYVYKYEVQINQINSKTIEGVTYSYKQKQFYGKAAFKGLYTKTTKNVLLKETKMLEMKTTENSVPCLMTCYLDYSKSGNVERLSGTFSSVESTDKRDCGSGTVVLKKTLISDFKKEDFLIKKTITKPNSTINKPKTILKNSTTPTTNKPPQKSVIEHKKVLSTNANNNKTLEQKKLSVVIPDSESSKPIDASILLNSPKKIITDATPNIIKAKPLEIPEILKSRVNKLVNKIIVNVKDITVDYYDNGEIDGDIISVYNNNVRVINHDTLSTKPLRLNIHTDENDPVHELITVAENLGRIPPNTCLMVITAGRQRLEIPMSSDEKTNAKVLIEYRENEGTKISRQN